MILSKSCVLDALTGEEEPFERPPPGQTGFGPGQEQPSPNQVKALENQQAIKDLLAIQYHHKQVGQPQTSAASLEIKLGEEADDGEEGEDGPQIRPTNSQAEAEPRAEEESKTTAKKAKAEGGQGRQSRRPESYSGPTDFPDVERLARRPSGNRVVAYRYGVGRQPSGTLNLPIPYSASLPSIFANRASTLVTRPAGNFARNSFAGRGFSGVGRGASKIASSKAVAHYGNQSATDAIGKLRATRVDQPLSVSSQSKQSMAMMAIKKEVMTPSANEAEARQPEIMTEANAIVIPSDANPG